MSKKIKKTKTYLLFSVFLVVFIIFAKNSLATTSRYKVYLSYWAETNVPFDYQAKNLATYGSKIKIRAAVFDSQGRLLPEKRFLFYWSVNGSKNFFDYSEERFFVPSYGKNQIVISNLKEKGKINVAVLVLDRYNNKTSESLIIPISKKRVLVCPENSKVFWSKIGWQKELSFKSVGFNFNLSELENFSYMWILDGLGIAEKPILKLKISKPEKERSLYLKLFNPQTGQSVMSPIVKIIP